VEEDEVKRNVQNVVGQATLKDLECEDPKQLKNPVMKRIFHHHFLFESVLKQARLLLCRILVKPALALTK
jgi:hypothetical protein